MAMNMNKTLNTLCQELYETEGLQAVRDLAKQIPAWCKKAADMEKRGAIEEKRLQASQKKLDCMEKHAEKYGKAVIKELRKNATFKQLKTHIAEAEKSQKKAKIEAAKLAKEMAKAEPKPSKATKAWSKFFTKSMKNVEKDAKKASTQLKAFVKIHKAALAKAEKARAKAAKLAAKEAKVMPSKDDLKQAKRWAKLLTKSVKSGEADTKKAITQLRRLVKAKKADDAKVAKAAAKAAKKLEPKVKGKKKAVEEVPVGDDLIATLLSKANATVAEPIETSPVKEEEVDKDTCMLQVDEEWEDRGECPGCESGIDCDHAHRRITDGEYYSACCCNPDCKEEELKVVRFEHNGVKYLKDDEGYLYDPKTQEEVGWWNYLDKVVQDQWEEGTGWY